MAASALHGARVRTRRARFLFRRGSPLATMPRPSDDRQRPTPGERLAATTSSAPRAGHALPQPAPLPRADGRGRADARRAPALGRQPLLLPGVHPDQGRGDPLQLPRGRGAPRVDPADRRPRRHGGRDGRDRVVAAPRRGARGDARGARLRAARAPGRALRRRRLRELRAPAAVDQGRRVIAHGAVRPGRDPGAARRARAPLHMDRPRRPAVLPRPARPGAARRGVRARPRRRALPHPRAAGCRRGGAALQDRGAVGAARCDRARRHPAARRDGGTRVAKRG